MSKPTQTHWVYQGGQMIEVFIGYNPHTNVTIGPDWSANYARVWNYTKEHCDLTATQLQYGDTMVDADHPNFRDLAITAGLQSGVFFVKGRKRATQHTYRAMLREKPITGRSGIAYRNYDHYLQSNEWRALATAVKTFAGFRCQVCNAHQDDTRMDVHHRTYERIGQERFDDLIALCGDCHEKHHEVKQ